MLDTPRSSPSYIIEVAIGIANSLWERDGPEDGVVIEVDANKLAASGVIGQHVRRGINSTTCIKDLV